MTKDALLTKVIARGLEAHDAAIAVDAFWDVITEALTTNDKILIVHGDLRIIARVEKRSWWGRFWGRFDAIFA